MTSRQQQDSDSSGARGRRWSGSLTTSEVALIDRAASGEVLDLGGDVASPEVSRRTPLETMRAWGPDQIIRGEVLRHLLVERQWPVHAKGVQLRHAGVSGQLDLESATLRCPLVLEDCYLGSEQPVVFDYATVSLLRLLYCHLTDLTANMMVVTRDVDLSGSRIGGTVWLSGAVIAGMLSCTGTEITGSDWSGRALIADRVKVGGDVLFGDGFSTDGAIWLANADIAGDFVCDGAHISCSDRTRDVLVADKVEVGGSVYLGHGFSANGAVRLLDAQIDGSLILRKATLAEPVALMAEGAKIGQDLVWAPTEPVAGSVSLERAQAHHLNDDWSKEGAYWPPAGKLRLAGFVYEGFSGDYPGTWRQRLNWIRSQNSRPLPGQPARFDIQVYEQLAGVYRQAGHVAEARRIVIARRTDMDVYLGRSWLRRLGNRYMNETIRSGLPGRAVALLLSVYMLAFVLSVVAQHQVGVMVPAKDIQFLRSEPTAMVCTADYPCFYPAGYAIDLAIPIVNVHQAENWRIDGAANWGWAYVDGAWIITGLGWIFTTLAVTFYTGLIRKD